MNMKTIANTLLGVFCLVSVVSTNGFAQDNGAGSVPEKKSMVSVDSDNSEARLRALLKDLEDNPPENADDRAALLTSIREINARLASQRRHSSLTSTVERKGVESAPVIPVTATMPSKESTRDPELGGAGMPSREPAQAVSMEALATRIAELEVKLAAMSEKLAVSDKKLEWLYSQLKSQKLADSK
jgi:uncharacterized coiled-coil protein SlyX